MRKNALGLFIWSAAYIATFCYIYINYLNRVYGSELYPIINRTDTQFTISLLLAMGPILFYGFRRTVSAVLTAVIYVAYYVPSILITYYSLARPWSEILVLHASLAFAMCALFLAGRYPAMLVEKQAISKAHMDAVLLISMVLILVLILVFHGHMRLVSFRDVYDLRSETNALDKIFLINYFVALLQYCFIPLLLARGMANGKMRSLALAVAGSLVLYMSTGSKTAILTPFIMLGFFVLMHARGDLLKNILMSVTVLSILLIVTLPESEGALAMVKPVLFSRVLAASGFATNAYYDFFSSHAHTHLAQIGIVNGLTGEYPYGSLQLGQIFGVQEADQSINAGFWASEGIASFGVVGIYFATALVAAYLILINWLSRRFEWRLIGLWMCGLAMAICNLPFFTLMLTGGGAFFIALLFWFGTVLRVRANEPEAATTPVAVGEAIALDA